MHERAFQRAMPVFDQGRPTVSHFEFWPGWLFYAPMWAWILLLAIRHRSLTLPLSANPGLPAGGLVGEEKHLSFAALQGEEARTLAPWIVTRCDESPAVLVAELAGRIARAGLSFPLVAKPNIGCRGSGVRPVRNLAELHDYLADFPRGEEIILQQLVEAEGEAGVFYVRRPGQRQGRIISLTLKYFPHVVGDGRSTIEQLVRADDRAGQLAHLYLPRLAERLHEVPPAGESVRLVFAGNHCRGAIFRDGRRHITRALRLRFDRIADAIPGFHFGRFDVRFADFAAFQQGEGFTIVEFNGAGAEATHIWDSGASLLRAWGDLAGQYRLLFAIGAANRRLGHRSESLVQVVRRWLGERRATRRHPLTA